MSQIQYHMMHAILLSLLNCNFLNGVKYDLIPTSTTIYLFSSIHVGMYGTFRIVTYFYFYHLLPILIFSSAMGQHQQIPRYHDINSLGNKH